jgi:hypothetical protein
MARVPSEKALVFWLNSLGIESAILVDRLSDVLEAQSETLRDVVNLIVSGPDSTLPAPKTLSSALALLAKHEGWENMAPNIAMLSPDDVATRAENNETTILRALVAGLRVMYIRKQKHRANHTAREYKPASPSAFGRTTRGNTQPQVPKSQPHERSNKRQRSKRQAVDQLIGGDRFDNLSDNQLEVLQTRVKQMLKAEQQAAAEQTAEARRRAAVHHNVPTHQRVKVHTRAWEPDQGGWNKSTAAGAGHRSANNSVKTALLKGNALKAMRGTRSFVKGVERVDKTGMVAHGIYDPTYAPSVKRLYELGFSPRKVKMLGRKQSSVTFAENLSDRAMADSVRGDSVDNEPGSNAAAHRAKERRRKLIEEDIEQQPWEKKLRTPSKLRRSRAVVGEGNRQHGEELKASVDSMALSEKQNGLLKWVRQNGIDPCPERGAKAVTAQAVATGFSNGVLLCQLVAMLELRAGGRGVNAVSKTSNGGLNLEGVQLNPRTTAANTANINCALKVLRNRKKMNPRHLWAATQIRNGEPMVIWQILDDIRREYSAWMPQARMRAAQKRQTRIAAQQEAEMARFKKMNGHKVPSKRGANLSLGIHRDVLGHSASASQKMPFGLLKPTALSSENGVLHSRKSSRSKPHPRMQTSNAAGSPLGRGQLRKSKHVEPAVLVFHAPMGNRPVASDAQYAFQDISAEQEGALRTWLKQMGFGVPPGGKNGSPLPITNDPLRNGTLLCALVQILDPDQARDAMAGVHRKPYNVRQSRENVDLALSVLRSRMYSAIPAPYLFQAEAIVKGTRAVLWGLLFHLKRVIDSFAPNPAELRSMTKALVAKKEREKIESSVEYTSEEQWALERSLLSWLHSLNVLENNTLVPRDFVEVEREVRGGTLLCKTVGAVRGIPVIGWMKKVDGKPKLARKNIEKALKAIRETPGMGQRHAWKGDELFRGERHHIIGLFEDLHRFYDDIPPRPTFLKGKETPYFGSHVPAPEDMSLPHAHLAFPPSGTGASLLVGPRVDKSSTKIAEHDEEVLETARLDADAAAASATTRAIPLDGNPNHTLSYTAAGYSTSFYDDISDIFPDQRMDRAELSGEPSGRVLGSDSNAANDFKALGSIFIDRDSAMDIVPGATSRGTYGLMSTNAIHTAAEHSKATYDNSKLRHSQRVRNLETTGPGIDGGGTIAQMMEEDTLVKWIRSCGIPVARPDDFHKDKASEWCDGVKLCRLIEAVQKGRKEIRGVVSEPKNTAQCLNNHRRAMEVLRQKSNMPVELIFSEDRLVEGDTDLLVPLLQAIRKSYGQHLMKGTRSGKNAKQ